MIAKKFKVKVNGREFEVEVEEIGDSVCAEIVRSEPAVAPKTTHVAKAYKRGAGVISAPIPGKVLSVDKKTGESIKRGERLLLIESMKIENPILSPRDGIAKTIHVAVGAQVKTGDPLVTIE